MTRPAPNDRRCTLIDRRLTVLVAICCAVLVAAGCAGGGVSGSSGVASLEDVASAEGDDPAAPTTEAGSEPEATADDAALEFSQCMRDEGLDFPDIGVDASGNPRIRDAFESAGIQPRSTEFQDAMENCAGILEQAGFGAGRQRLGDSPELQDALVGFSECIRDQGFDVGDLQLGGPPGAGNGDGEPAQRGQGQGRGEFSNRSERLATALGLDPEDLAVADALDVCSPILETALGQVQPGND